MIDHFLTRNSLNLNKIFGKMIIENFIFVEGQIMSVTQKRLVKTVCFGFFILVELLRLP